MRESEFQEWILDVAARFSWRAWHVPFPMRPIGGGRFVPEPRAAGLPDLLLLHEGPPRMILAEVKVDAPLSVAQREFLRLARAVAEAFRDSLRFAGADEEFVRGEIPLGVYTWRPGNEELIEAILRGKTMVAS